MRALALLPAAFLLPLTSAQQHPHIRPASPADLQTLRELQTQSHPANPEFLALLNLLPPDALHSALHQHAERFQDGVYETDRSAVAAVHARDPPAATRLLAAAALDLVRRQAELAAPEPHFEKLGKRQNGTVTSSTPPPPPPPASTSTTPTATVLVPVTLTTTNSAGSTVEQTATVIAAASTSVEVAVTTTSNGRTITTSTVVPAAVVTSAGQTSLSPLSTFVPAPVTPTTMKTTDSKGRTVLTTITPSASKVSSLLLLTTTAADGRPVTLTSWAVVQPIAAGGAEETGSSGPKLQPSGAGRVTVGSWGGFLGLVLGGVVAGVALMVV
ncbi:hypothetical protein EJ06DRAFT_522886 [Trichodelitschia bisporula]|uniref:ASX DEUBAD domain-containing protein n=1 Tax=Trichodelitschia bisporula TaxID=703511 RepID=A0A6G1HRF1_9PEZI|nr:hypothetical protein EJ06DRAFT_522886 [Trichodelitschia bisporula]